MSRIICRCEDVTEEEIVEAIHMGFDTLEALKRHLRVGTGPCQGRTCTPLIMGILARETGKKPEELSLPTHRPPTRPLPIGDFAEFAEGDPALEEEP